MAHDPKERAAVETDDFDELSAHIHLVGEVRTLVHEGFTTLIFIHPDGRQHIVTIEFGEK